MAGYTHITWDIHGYITWCPKCDKAFQSTFGEQTVFTCVCGEHIIIEDVDPRRGD